MKMVHLHGSIHYCCCAGVAAEIRCWMLSVPRHLQLSLRRRPRRPRRKVLLRFPRNKLPFSLDVVHIYTVLFEDFLSRFIQSSTSRHVTSRHVTLQLTAEKLESEVIFAFFSNFEKTGSQLERNRVRIAPLIRTFQGAEVYKKASSF